MTIFLYGGSTSVPFSALVSTDGESTWTEAVFENAPEHYGMAYTPVLEDGVYTLYVGEEAYSKEEGGKYRFSVWMKDGRGNGRNKGCSFSVYLLECECQSHTDNGTEKL